jgi:hypothetical protein
MPPKNALFALCLFGSTNILLSQPPPWAQKIIEKSQQEVVWHSSTPEEALKTIEIVIYVDNKPIKTFVIPVCRDARGGGLTSIPIEDDKFLFSVDPSKVRDWSGTVEGNIWECAHMPNGIAIGISRS